MRNRPRSQAALLTRQMIVSAFCVLGIGCTGISSKMVDTAGEALEQTQEETAALQSEQTECQGPTLKFCHDAPLPPDRNDEEWNRLSSRVAGAALAPRHVASDVLTTPNSDALIEAKFSYGTLNKDLEHEEIEIWYDDCSGEFQKLATLETDGEGWINYVWPREELPSYGMYRLYFRVVADRSEAYSVVRVLPEGTQLAVFDIDGTLTRSNQELWKSWLADAGRLFGVSDYIPEARIKAAELTQYLAWEMGYVPIYLTGRLYWMEARTRDWMTTLHVAPGHLRMTPTWSQWRPTTDGIGTFKSDYLNQLRDDGFQISRMYGNAATDAWAYDTIHRESEKIFIVGEDPKMDDITFLGDSYYQHIRQMEVADNKPIDQPFCYPEGTTDDTE